jgi:hypothetical protein
MAVASADGNGLAPYADRPSLDAVVHYPLTGRSANHRTDTIDWLDNTCRNTPVGQTPDHGTCSCVWVTANRSPTAPTRTLLLAMITHVVVTALHLPMNVNRRDAMLDNQMLLDRSRREKEDGLGTR